MNAVVTHPEKCRQEGKWQETSYLRPSSVVDNVIPDSTLQLFKDLIWNNAANDMLPRYGNNPEELAALCGESSEGWIFSGHVLWLLDVINTSGKGTLGFCINTVSAVGAIRSLQKRVDLATIRQLVFIVNVGQNPDGSVFLGGSERSGNHWALAVVKLGTLTPTILYCDSLGWDYPTELTDELMNYLGHFDVERIDKSNIRMTHVPTPGFRHECGPHCLNYPLQTCVCGVVALLCASIAAYDPDLFSYITKPGNAQKIYLNFPTKYEKYLRIVLISWFVKGSVDIKNLSLRVMPQQGDDDCYTVRSCPKVSLKRKVASGPSTEQQDRKFNKFLSPNIPVVPTTSTAGKTPSVPEASTFVTVLCMASTAGKPASEATTPTLPAVENLKLPSQSNNVFPLPSKLSDIKCKPTEKQVKIPVSKSTKAAAKHVCTFCNVQFSSRQSLWKHKKRSHAQDLHSITGQITCTQCKDFKCARIQDLIQHQRLVHGKDIRMQTSSFPSQKEFLCWKQEMEKDTKAEFVKAFGSKSGKNSTVTRYYCQRSGFFKPVAEKRQRSLKSQGTSKISTKCCSYITARECISTGTVIVEYCLDHVGHSVQLAHLKLSDEMRTVIAEKLASGVDTSKVLDDIRECISGVDRDSLVTKKDIDNIRRQYRVSNTDGHVDDSESVGIWVQKLREGTYDPVVVHKVQGDEHDTLKKDDFLLCVQTKFQRDMMRKYGHKMICVDSTHGTTQYHFMLTTVLVLDDYGEAIPTAWAISNSEDAEILEVFLNGLKTKGGQDYKTDVFMSDLADNFYNAWCKTFSKPGKRLYCSWHVDKAWKKNIPSVVKSEEQQSEIYGHLKDVQMETDERVFIKKLQDLLLLLQDISPAFHGYFRSHYVVDEKVRLWAACFRRGTLANANMFAESFHRLLKGLHFKRNENRTVDDLLVVLLKLSRDKAIEQLIKSQKGKVTHRLREVKKRHQSAVDVDNITCIGEELWSVSSTSTCGLQYGVEKVASHEACKCKLLCDLCHVCVHMYSCTCADFLMNAVSCEHIHAVHSMNVTHGTVALDSEEEEDDQLQYFTDLLSDQKKEVSDETDQLRTSALLVINELTDIVKEECNADTLRTICQRAKAVVTIAQGLKTGCQT